MLSRSSYFRSLLPVLPGNCIMDELAELLHFCLVVGDGSHRELVPAVAGNEVPPGTLRTCPAERVSDTAERPVAFKVPVPVVYVLELVHIHHHKVDARFGMVQHVQQKAPEFVPVVQLRERVLRDEVVERVHVYVYHCERTAVAEDGNCQVKHLEHGGKHDCERVDARRNVQAAPRRVFLFEGPAECLYRRTQHVQEGQGNHKHVQSGGLQLLLFGRPVVELQQKAGNGQHDGDECRNGTDEAGAELFDGFISLQYRQIDVPVICPECRDGKENDVNQIGQVGRFRPYGTAVQEYPQAVKAEVDDVQDQDAVKAALPFLPVNARDVLDQYESENQQADNICFYIVQTRFVQGPRSGTINDIMV